jgi:hypothetical protein
MARLNDESRVQQRESLHRLEYRVMAGPISWALGVNARACGKCKMILVGWSSESSRAQPTMEFFCFPVPLP